MESANFLAESFEGHPGALSQDGGD